MSLTLLPPSESSIPSVYRCDISPVRAYRANITPASIPNPVSVDVLVKCHKDRPIINDTSIENPIECVTPLWTGLNTSKIFVKPTPTDTDIKLSVKNSVIALTEFVIDSHNSPVVNGNWLSVTAISELVPRNNPYLKRLFVFDAWWSISGKTLEPSDTGREVPMIAIASSNSYPRLITDTKTTMDNPE